MELTIGRIALGSVGIKVNPMTGELILGTPPFVRRFWAA
jgi:hypothetical protein